jgi:hypothetical protein
MSLSDQQFKSKIITNYIVYIEQDISKKEHLCNHYIWCINFCYWTHIFLSGISLIMSSSTLVVFNVSDKSINPFICITSIVNAGSLFLDFILNKIQQKLTVQKSIKKRMQKYKMQLQEMISEIITDSIITNEELKQVNLFMSEYEKQKSLIVQDLIIEDKPVIKT